MAKIWVKDGKNFQQIEEGILKNLPKEGNTYGGFSVASAEEVDEYIKSQGGNSQVADAFNVSVAPENPLETLSKKVQKDIQAQKEGLLGQSEETKDPDFPEEFEELTGVVFDTENYYTPDELPEDRKEKFDQISKELEEVLRKPKSEAKAKEEPKPEATGYVKEVKEEKPQEQPEPTPAPKVGDISARDQEYLDKLAQSESESEEVKQIEEKPTPAPSGRNSRRTV